MNRARGPLCAALLVLALGASPAGASGSVTPTPGLPNTPDYHSLLVDPSDSKKLVLGTHNGLYVSTDGGRSWRFDALARQDAMNLTRSSGKTIWLAGHDVFKKSADAGRSWRDVRPAGLPHLDIHGFAVDPRRPATLYAAMANVGLYRSTNAGRSFAKVSSRVGGDVMALAAMPDGRILAADMQRGLLESRNGGRSWRTVLTARLYGLAVHPTDPRRVLATSGGIVLSTDGGRSWVATLVLRKGLGPVAWSPGNPRIAYAVGLDRRLYRSVDSGRSWKPVPPAQ